VVEEWKRKKENEMRSGKRKERIIVGIREEECKRNIIKEK